jgi:hypothetical protein
MKCLWQKVVESDLKKSEYKTFNSEVYCLECHGYDIGCPNSTSCKYSLALYEEYWERFK